MRTLKRAVLLFTLCTLAGVLVAPALSAAEQRLHSALHCTPNVPFSYHFNGATLNANANGALRCSYVGDSLLPTGGVAIIPTKVGDWSSTAAVVAQACTSSSLSVNCGPAASSSVAGMGDQTLNVASSAWVNNPSQVPYVYVSLPSGCRFYSYLVDD